MSQQNAIAFIQKIRNDKQLNRMIQSYGSHADLDDILKIGRDAGFLFTVDDLRAAFSHDWGMRWFFYCRQDKSV